MIKNTTKKPAIGQRWSYKDTHDEMIVEILSVNSVIYKVVQIKKGSWRVINNKYNSPSLDCIYFKITADDENWFYLEGQEKVS